MALLQPKLRTQTFLFSVSFSYSRLSVLSEPSAYIYMFYYIYFLFYLGTRLRQYYFLYIAILSYIQKVNPNSFLLEWIWIGYLFHKRSSMTK